MKTTYCSILSAQIILLTLANPARAAEELPAKQQPLVLQTIEQKASYGLGLTIGQNLKADGVEVIPEILAQGIIDVLKGRKSRLPDDQLRTAMMAFEKQMQAKREAVTKSASTRNRKQAQAFLAANKKKPGVKSLPGGLQYQVLRPGKGRSPAATNTVKAHYHGTLINGTVFDSSVQRKEPIDFPLNQVIPGWTQAVTKMKVGGKWRLFIPPDLAYGDSPPAGAPIEPGMLLIFEVELLDIVN